MNDRSETKHTSPDKWMDKWVPKQPLSIVQFVSSDLDWDPRFDPYIDSDVKQALLDSQCPFPTGIGSPAEVKIDSIRNVSLRISRDTRIEVRCLFSRTMRDRLKRLAAGIFMIPDPLLGDSHRLSLYYAGRVIAKSTRNNCSISVYDMWMNTRAKLIMTSLAYHEMIRLQAQEQTDSKIGQSLERLHRDIGSFMSYFPSPMPFPIVLVVDIMRRCQSKRVLDIAAGYGDRLLAACLSSTSYVSADPNQDLQPVYAHIIKDFGRPGCHYNIHPCPFEDVDLSKEEPFDTLISSPPFFNLEQYDGNKTGQSTVRYPALETWTKEYLWTSLAKCDQVLKRGAWIYLHMCDLCDTHESYVEKTIEFMEFELKWTFVAYYGYAKQYVEPASDASKGSHCKSSEGLQMLAPGRGVKCQPLFVFQKP